MREKRFRKCGEKWGRRGSGTARRAKRREEKRARKRTSDVNPISVVAPPPPLADTFDFRILESTTNQENHEKRLWRGSPPFFTFLDDTFHVVSRLDCSSIQRARRAGCGAVAAASGRGGRRCSRACSARRLRGRRTSRGRTSETGRTSSTILLVSRRPSIPSCPSSPGARACRAPRRTASEPPSPSTATRSRWADRTTGTTESTWARCGFTRATPPATANPRGR